LFGEFSVELIGEEQKIKRVEEKTKKNFFALFYCNELRKENSFSYVWNVKLKRDTFGLVFRL